MSLHIRRCSLHFLRAGRALGEPASIITTVILFHGDSHSASSYLLTTFSSVLSWSYKGYWISGSKHVMLLKSNNFPLASCDSIHLEREREREREREGGGSQWDPPEDVTIQGINIWKPFKDDGVDSFILFYISAPYLLLDVERQKMIDVQFWSYRPLQTCLVFCSRVF